MYIWQARKYLRNSSLLSQPYLSESSPDSPQASPETKQVLRHLVMSNLLVIALDIALLGVQYADLFYLQGAFKPCVYGVKLKVEFAILNRLLEMVRRRGSGGGSSYSDSNALRGESQHRGTGGIFRGNSEQHSQIKPEGGLHVQVTSSAGSTRRAQPWEDDNADDVSPMTPGADRELGLPLGRLERPTTGPSARSYSRTSQDPIWDSEPRHVPGTAV